MSFSTISVTSCHSRHPGHVRINNSRASQPEDYRPPVIILSDPDTGEILGGLWGETRGFRLQRRPMSAMPPLGLSVELAALMAL
jgi:hypothetical protein